MKAFSAGFYKKIPKNPVICKIRATILYIYNRFFSCLIKTALFRIGFGLFLLFDFQRCLPIFVKVCFLCYPSLLLSLILYYCPLSLSLVLRYPPLLLSLVLRYCSPTLLTYFSIIYEYMFIFSFIATQALLLSLT